jgi:hypothetical protein
MKTRELINIAHHSSVSCTKLVTYRRHSVHEVEAKMDDTLINLNELTKLIDLSPQRTCQLAKDGHIPKSSAGRYPRDACVTAYIRYLKSSRTPTNSADLAKARADNLRVKSFN